MKLVQLVQHPMGNLIQFTDLVQLAQGYKFKPDYQKSVVYLPNSDSLYIDLQATLSTYICS